MMAGLTKMSKTFLGLIIITMFMNLLGCVARPKNMTPEQEARYQEAEEQRVKEMLSETSPRNMSPQPKAVPEFNTNIPAWRRCR